MIHLKQFLDRPTGYEIPWGAPLYHRSNAKDMGGPALSFIPKLFCRPLEMTKTISDTALSGFQVPGGILPFSFLEFQVIELSTSFVENAENSRHSVLSAKA